jgi:hypothetical protein
LLFRIANRARGGFATEQHLHRPGDTRFVPLPQPGHGMAGKRQPNFQIPAVARISIALQEMTLGPYGKTCRRSNVCIDEGRAVAFYRREFPQREIVFNVFCP